MLVLHRWFDLVWIWIGLVVVSISISIYIGFLFYILLFFLNGFSYTQFPIEKVFFSSLVLFRLIKYQTEFNRKFKIRI